jgi:predicted  nucleic acid-binding Zn-ribbon protein
LCVLVYLAHFLTVASLHFYYGKQISKLKSECRKAEQHIQVLNQTLSEGTTQLQSYVTTAQLQSQTLQENIETLEDSVSNKVLLIEALEVRSVIPRPCLLKKKRIWSHQSILLLVLN